MLTRIEHAVPSVVGTLSFEAFEQGGEYRIVVYKRKGVKAHDVAHRPLNAFMRENCFEGVSRYTVPSEWTGVADRYEYQWFPECPGPSVKHTCARGGDVDIPEQR